MRLLLQTLTKPISLLQARAASHSFKVGKLNHVAIAVPCIQTALKLYKDTLGCRCSDVQHLPSHGVSTVFVHLGDSTIELITPYGEHSPIQSFLQKNKRGGLHHICLEVDNIKEAMSNLKNEGYQTLKEDPEIGAHGDPVIFLHPKNCNGVLLELEEVKKL